MDLSGWRYWRPKVFSRTRHWVSRPANLALEPRTELGVDKRQNERLDIGENVFEFEFWFVGFEALQAIAIFE